PHEESPPLAPVMASFVVPSKSAFSGTPPAADEVNAILRTILDTDSAQTSLDASYALTNLLIQSVGVRGLHTYNLISEIKKAAADKKNGAKRESAMFILGAMFERFPRVQPLSEVVFLVQDGGLFSLVLDGLADKGSSVRESAQYAVDELFKNLES